MGFGELGNQMGDNLSWGLDWLCTKHWFRHTGGLDCCWRWEGREGGLETRRQSQLRTKWAWRPHGKESMLKRVPQRNTNQSMSSSSFQSCFISPFSFSSGQGEQGVGGPKGVWRGGQMGENCQLVTACKVYIPRLWSVCRFQNALPAHFRKSGW